MPHPEAQTSNTKQRLLDAAESLFSARGAAATSLRAITNAAGANPAAIHYHYGSKEGLLVAVARRRADPVNRERLERLDRLEASHAGVPPIEQILDAFLHPEILGSEFGVSVILHHEPRETVVEIVPKVFGEVHRRFSAALKRSLPELDPCELDVRFHFVIGLMLHVLRGFTHMPVPGTDDGPAALQPRLGLEAVVESLIVFSAAGLRASPSRGGPTVIATRPPLAPAQADDSRAAAAARPARRPKKVASPRETPLE